MPELSIPILCPVGEGPTDGMFKDLFRILTFSREHFFRALITRPSTYTGVLDACREDARSGPAGSDLQLKRH